jgi:hypothetical protein
MLRVDPDLFMLGALSRTEQTMLMHRFENTVGYGLANAFLLGFALLVTACGDTHVPHEPVIRIAQDSVYLTLDDAVAYDRVEMFLGHGGHIFFPIGGWIRDLKEGGSFVIPLSAWSWHNDTTLEHQYLWHAEKPEFVYCDLVTTDGVFLRRLWYHTDDGYATLFGGVRVDTTLVDSLLRPCPDSLQHLFSRAEMTWMSASTCSLPPWPEEEDSADARPATLFPDSAEFRVHGIDQLPPGYGAGPGAKRPDE